MPPDARRMSRLALAVVALGAAGCDRWVRETRPDTAWSLTASDLRATAIATDADTDDLFVLLDGGAGRLGAQAVAGPAVVRLSVLDGAVVWSASLPAGGTAAQAALAGSDLVVYLHPAEGGGALLRLAGGDGRILWNVAAPPAGSGVAYPFTARLVAGGPQGEAALVDCSATCATAEVHRADGGLAWRAGAPSAIQALAFLDNGDLAVTTDGALQRLRAADGSTAWTVALAGRGDSLAAAAGNGAVVAGRFTEGARGGIDVFVLAVDSVGRARWAAQWYGSREDHLWGAVSVARSGLAVVTVRFRKKVTTGGAVLLGIGTDSAVGVLDPATGDLLDARVFGTRVDGPAVVDGAVGGSGGRVYAAGGLVAALDL